jgi:nucleoside-diphosphate-sugar epimerase
MQFVYVKDLVRALLRSIEVDAAVGEAFNIGNPKPLTQVEAVREMSRTAGKKPELVRVPREKIAAAGGNVMSEPFYFGQYLDLPPITENVSKLQRVLSVRLTAFATGFRETHRWYLRKPRRKSDFSFEDRLIAAAGVRRDI